MTQYTPKLDQLFSENSELDFVNLQQLIRDELNSFDDGELFLELNQSEFFSFDDGVLKNSSLNSDMGYGVRGIIGERCGYAHSSNLSYESIKDSLNTIKMVKAGYDGDVKTSQNPTKTNLQLYDDDNPIYGMEFSSKIKLLTDIDQYLRKQDSRVKQVSASIAGQYQLVQIIRADGFTVCDKRPLVRLNIMVITEQNGRMGKGSYGMGGRSSYQDFTSMQSWQSAADKALKEATTALVAVPAPAGQMPVVLAGGWPGILLHEAIGHGLEGDFNRKKTSAFSGLLGQKVAAEGVTVIDDGTIAKRRGSLTVDDEGTPTKTTVLIENGILKNYMQDRLNARLMQMQATGNGRRESYAHTVLPRMTNTIMASGDKDPEEIIKSVKKGLYAANFGGGQVDITSGKFVFSASLAYLIEDGKITTPVRDATLIGNGPDVLTKVTMIGNDLQLDPGIGTCGKAGQGVPVGVGQPTILIGGLTVGGSG